MISCLPMIPIVLLFFTATPYFNVELLILFHISICILMYSLSFVLLSLMMFPTLFLYQYNQIWVNYGSWLILHCAFGMLFQELVALG